MQTSQKTVTRYATFAEAEEADRAYWRTAPLPEKFLAVRQISLAAYSFKGVRVEDGQRLSRVAAGAESM